ncbi:hypothetical protein [Piscibacillus halophilus]|uniref:ABC-2 family transporter protein n=1 Tax=Piscibacillus halophilus TaxID=571933 RepID=A0A1H9FEN2_9BACI|nr:hypothetical protein [Piscibacillus halophilus]SEQ36349.1 hypothetical protein SAMN05216362_1124 [Piscibacillus halophilus]
MKNFLKLTNFEFNRMSKLLFVLMGFVFLVQMIGVFYEVLSYKSRINQLITEAHMTQEQAINSIGQLSFDTIMYNMFFLGPVFISVGAILFYIFLIWYRDWLGKNTFIYRLLMLPTERLNIYFSKLATILMSTLCLVAFQFVALLLERAVFKMMLPEEFRVDTLLTILLENFPLTYLILPKSIDGFFIIYGAGAISVALIFTIILLERSYRMKGIVLGVLYAIASIVLVVAPGVINFELLPNAYLYEIEVIAISGAIAIVIGLVSILISRKLLNDRIRV